MLVAPVAWKFALKDYQKQRIQTFLDPEQDPRAPGYQQIQARITVGSGGLRGKGFRKGTQGQYKFLPVAHNDFIFSVLAEEQGFVGVLVALGLYLFVILRSLEAARLAKDRLGAYLVGGIIAGFAFQVIYNVTMSAGLAPVKGLTLPLMSYGGSSMIATLGGVRPDPQRADATVHELDSAGMASGTGCLRGRIAHPVAHRDSAPTCARDMRAGWRRWSGSCACRTPARSLGHEQGDDHLLERPRNVGRDPRGRPGRRVFIERERQRGVVGNIYKGRVSKVLPGMQSAFVDLGLERDGFLYVTDVVNTIEEFDRLETGDEDDAGHSRGHRDRP